MSRATYAALFAVIGTTYGAGDGSTTLNLPDLRGRVIVGRDAGQSEFDTLGEAGGAKTHTLTPDEMPVHTHVQDAHNHTQDAHQHTVPVNTSDGSGTMADRATTSGSATISTGNATATNQPATATNQDAGGGQAHNNLQPYVVLNWVIKA